MGKILFHIISVVLATAFLTSASLAAPVTAGVVFAFRDNEGANTVGTGQGDNFSFGVDRVKPDGNNGTTARATNGGYTEDPLPNLGYLGRPAAFGKDFTFSFAQANFLLDSWAITLTNIPDSTTYHTPPRNGVQKMEFVKNLSVSGSATSPKVSWQLPTTGATVDRVRYEVWDDDTNQVLSGPTSLGPGAVSVSPTGLISGGNYAIRITPEQWIPGAPPISRSSNWINWQAIGGVGIGSVLRLTAGSPAGASQTVDTPGETFTVEFDYRFTTETGFLDVMLDGTNIGARLDASENQGGEFLRAVFEVEEVSLLNLSAVELLFLLDGPPGSNLMIDNIIFPGLANGDFEDGLNLWMAQGGGIVTTEPVPIPATGWLFATGIIGLVGFRCKIRGK
jgi:hypothetical protein